MSIWNYIVVGLGLVLLVFLLAGELTRKNRARLAARTMATTLAVGALVCLGLPMSCRREKAAGPEKAAVVEKPAEGIVRVDWKRKLVKGEPLRIQGRWQGASVRLFLEGTGRVLDSAVVGKDSGFVLGTTPALVGLSIYRLRAVRGKDTIELEDMPVEVEVGKPLRILVLASSPSAENTFLVSWLGKGGHEVASRTLVSKDKYQSSFANMSQRSLERVNTALLDEFDLVVADSASVTEVLRKQVKEKGMGLVIRMDSLGEGRVKLGAGRIVRTAQSTFALALAGEEEKYAAYWSGLLRDVAKEEEGIVWEWTPALPRVGEPVEARVSAGMGGMPQAMLGARSATVYLAEDGVLPFSWSGRYWPEKSGWQTASLLRGDTAFWYVWPEGAWKAMNVPVPEESVGATPVEEERVPLSKSWFYALFLLSALFLWIERKIL
ncbi:MAG: hypothetical protein JST68_25545 [Bacteroidetes bacterium]|nr:hypothetical protein [Bacteroidota bacterium]